MSEIEVVDLQRLMKADQKAQVFLNGFVSTDPGTVELLSQQLRPRDEDWAKVFVPDAVPRFQKYYQAMFHADPKPIGRPGQIRVRTFVAQAEQLLSENPLSDRFPGGYKKVAHLFQPGSIWISWKYTEPSKVIGMAYDGLVYLPDERFVWFPKPWRAGT